MIYLVSSYGNTTPIPEMNAHDSLGAQWYPLHSLTQDMLSPFAYTVVLRLDKRTL